MKARKRINPQCGTTWNMLRRVCATVVISATLISCGGGSSDDNTGEVIGTGHTGTVGTERRLASNNVEIRSASGERIDAPIDGNGRFTVKNTADSTGPYLSRVDLGNNEHLYGIGYEDASGNVKNNVHGYSDVIVRNWFAVNGSDVDSAFASPDSITLPTEAEVNTITAQLVSLLQLVLADYGVDGNQLLTVDFNADNTGVDNFLDQNPVLINNGTITIVVNQNITNIQTVVVSELPIDTDLSQADTQPPTTPDNVRALPVSASEILVVWSPSTDNIGVSAYRVFRDGVDIGETPYPVFSDTSVTSGVIVNYTVVAVDAAGNVSAESSAASAQTSGDVDTVAPSAPLTLATSTVTSNSVSLNWQHADVSDVASFELMGGPAGQAATSIAITSGTFVTDSSLDMGVEYCYTVLAIDAAGNKSPASAEVCATTGGSVTPPTTTPTPTANVLSLASNALTVLESSQKVTITVDRSGSAGEASVEYTVTDGSAVNGQDYTATNGTLTWADGITSSQSFDIQIATDSEAEADEDFTVALANPSNASLGAISTTTVTISDSAAASCDNEIENLVIDTDIVLGLPCYLVDGRIDVREPANLTIQPGVELRFTSGSGVIVRQGGSLTAEGNATGPILMTGVEKNPGFWGGVYFFQTNSSNNKLNFVTIEYGGQTSSLDSNLAVDNSTVSVANSTLRFSETYGFAFRGDNTISLFEDNTVTANGVVGSSNAVSAGAISANNAMTGNSADIVDVNNDVIDAATTWANIGVAWLASTLDVRADFAIAAGNEVRFNSDGRILIRDSGSLAVNGTADASVLFTGSTQTPGWWRSVYYFNSPSTLNTLNHLIIEYAGAVEGTNLLVDGTSRFSADSITLRNGSGAGFDFDGNAQVAAAAFTNVTSTANQTAGIVDANAAGAIGAGSSFTGNTVDQVVVRSSILDKAQTWLQHDVPYYIDGGDLRADLTLSPGVAVISKVGTQILVRDSGSLNAVGTTAQPIFFTGEQAVAGAWGGIQFFNSISQRNVLDFTVVEFGGTTDQSGNVTANCSSPTIPAVTVSNSSFENSAGWGIFVTSNCSVAIGDGVAYMGNAAGEINAQ